MNEYRKLSERCKCKGNLLDYYDCDVEIPDGTVAQWDLLKHPGGAAVLPIDEDGNCILVRQYRLGVNKELLEIPAGKAEPGEDHLTTIRREMEEEIGYVADDISLMFEIAPVPAYSEEVTSVYLAKGLKKTEVNPDDDEFLRIEKHHIDDVVNMINTGEIIDGKTIAAVMTYAANNKENKNA